MPNSATLSRAVDTAAKCLATAPWVLMPRCSSASRSQARAMRALVRVSRVVKVLEAIMNRVVSGSRSPTFSAQSVGSMLEMKRHSRPSWT